MVALMVFWGGSLFGSRLPEAPFWGFSTDLPKVFQKVTLNSSLLFFEFRVGLT